MIVLHVSARCCVTLLAVENLDHFYHTPLLRNLTIHGHQMVVPKVSARSVDPNYTMHFIAFFVCGHSYLGQSITLRKLNPCGIVFSVY